MSRLRWPALVLLFVRVLPASAAPVDCAPCHAAIAESYRLTGMGRSFSRVASIPAFGKPFYHAASDSYFAMERRGSEYFQRRWQMDSAGNEINVLEKRVDFAMGSGNHSTAWLSRTARNTLIELPLAWYSEKGGYWGMNPGYDRPDHEGFRRTITYDCMFCHNAYPSIPAGHERPFAEPVYEGGLPEGIDCERCHGPGARHAALAKTAGARKEDVRRAIVNPARLSAPRQMDLCMQCHLETTSFPLPNTIQRYERGPFSYRPGEPLENFLFTFDRAPRAGHDDRFEIVSAAYRLRQSACFLNSGGAMTCTTCHNPHDIPRGEEAVRHYDAACGKCHAATGNAHFASGSCIACHMPKRRTEDVVHVAMTDHFIRSRQPAGDLLAERAERQEKYTGKVVPYYPAVLPRAPESELYLAMAQVIQESNLKEGIAQLTTALTRFAPKRPEYYLQLGEAWRSAGDVSKAIPWYEAAVQHDPRFVFGLQELGVALRRSGRRDEAVKRLREAASIAPANPVSWRELGLALTAPQEALAALQKAVSLDPDMAEAHNNLGVVWLRERDEVRAEAAFREAIRIQPDYADAQANLAGLLSEAGRATEAAAHFEISLRLRPGDAATHYGYALLLGRERQFDDARRQLEESLRIDPRFADSHELLGDLMTARDEAKGAVEHYREAVRIRPNSGRDRLRLGSALVSAGDPEGGAAQLRKAAEDHDPAVREEAVQLLRQLGKR